MLTCEKFTPEALLTGPRRSPAVPNHDGTLALYTLSTYNLQEGKATEEVKVVHIQGGSSRVIATSRTKAPEALWMPGESNEVVLLEEGDNGTTRVVVDGALEPFSTRYCVSELPGAVRAMKLVALDQDNVALAVVGVVGDDGHLFNESRNKGKDTAKVYDTPDISMENGTPVQHRKSTIWYSQLRRIGGRWELASSLHNLVPPGHSDLEVPDGDVDDLFAVGREGIVFAARSGTPLFYPQGSPGDSKVYFSPVDSFSAGCWLAPDLVSVPVSSPGLCYNVRFSPDGSVMAFMFRPSVSDGEPYPAPRILMGHVNSQAVLDIFQVVTAEEPTLPPRAFEFAGSSERIFLSTVDCGRVTLQSLFLHDGARPRTFFRDGSAEGFHPLVEGQNDMLLVSSSSFLDASLWQVVDVKQEEEPRVVSSLTKQGKRLGLTPAMVDEIWFEGGDEVCVHAFTVKPAKFDPEKKYPVVVLLPQGPETPWLDSWSTMWNSAVWAEQGFVVVLPNLGGSTGYGAGFAARLFPVSAIDHSPYGAASQDMENLMQYLELLPYIDMDRTVVAGARQGAALISHIFRDDLLAGKFRCAIWHSGTTTGFLGALGSASPPTLVMQPLRDPSWSSAEGTALYRTLRNAGVRSRLVTFEDEGSDLSRPENVEVWYREVFRFAEECVGKGPSQ